MITILGPTATGKTDLAARVAFEMNGEVISADSRQVYRGMDIGTGKDLTSFTIEGQKMQYHLIDIAEPGTEYNIYKYQQDFFAVYRDIVERGRLPVLCGGSGMYLESVLRGYRLQAIDKDGSLRRSLEKKTDAALEMMLRSLKTLHNKTDLEDRERMIRAIEIALSPVEGNAASPFPEIENTLFGIRYPRGLQKSRITERLKARLKEGLVDETEALLRKGIAPERLIRYGLEYRWVTKYVTGEITYDAMFNALNTAIHQFSKRQMTWFRRMERQGFTILWLDGRWTIQEKMAFIRHHHRIV